MAYQIDFTASNYVSRSRRKMFLRLLLLATVVMICWGIRYTYVTYNQPTLNMKLAEYEAVARPIEEMSAAWDGAAKEYASLVRYYRLIWAANPTGFLNAAATESSPRLGRNFMPIGWKLTTGGECRLDYKYTFSSADKAAQARGIESELVNSITSIVNVAGGKVAVQGVQLENLLPVNELYVSAVFSLPDVKAFPAKERTLAGCVGEIGTMRRRVQNLPFELPESRLGKKTVQGAMVDYLAHGRDKPEFPVFDKAIDVAGWFARADQFIAKHNVPNDASARKRIKAAWSKIGEARFPWQRLRTLDNDELVQCTRDLGHVADGVKRFKGFLEQRHLDCIKKLEPLVEAYERNKVFNEPLIEGDLKERFAKIAGIAAARTSFRDEGGSEPAKLEKDGESFTFSWVRWTMSLGGADGRGSAKGQDGAASNGVDEPLTLEKIASCIRETLKAPGPGYVLDTLKVDFNSDGTVAGAVMEGLLPVKKVELKKESSGNGR